VCSVKYFSTVSAKFPPPPPIQIPSMGHVRDIGWGGGILEYLGNSVHTAYVYYTAVGQICTDYSTIVFTAYSLYSDSSTIVYTKYSLYTDHRKK